MLPQYGLINHLGNFSVPYLINISYKWTMINIYFKLQDNLFFLFFSNYYCFIFVLFIVDWIQWSYLKGART